MKQSKPELSKKEGGAYPVFALEDCIRFAEGIKDLGGSRTSVTKSVLAKHFGVAESTPSFFQKLSATKCFGIIDGWGSYLLTEQGRRYFYPTGDSDRVSAGLFFLSRPAAFSVLIRRFDGEKLPATSILGNILHQEAGITESWKDRLASVFVRSAQFLGIIDSNGFLRHDASMPTTQSTLEEPASTSHPSDASDSGKPSEIQRFKRSSAPASPGNTVWAFPFRGSYIRLETPEEMTPELWDKLDAYIKILKPSDEHQGE